MTAEEASRIVIAVGAIHGFVYAFALNRLARRLTACRWVDPEARVERPGGAWTADSTARLLLVSPVHDHRYPADLRTLVASSRWLLFTAPVWLLVYVLTFIVI